MKILLIILLALTCIFFVFQIYTTMSVNKTQAQPYKVIKTDKDFEIRFYPSATLATICSSAKSYKELGNSGFGKLARYIFGGNSRNEQISMTSPVHMDISDSASTMSFVMPSKYNSENLPVPNDANVNIKTTNDEFVAAIRFSGFASDKDIQHYSEKLKQILISHSIEFTGNFRYLGYNPPYQLFDRRNEIIVNIKWDSR